MDTGTSRHMYTTQRLKHIQMIVINLNSKLLMSVFDNYSRTVKKYILFLMCNVHKNLYLIISDVYIYKCFHRDFYFLENIMQYRN